MNIELLRTQTTTPLIFPVHLDKAINFILQHYSECTLDPFGSEGSCEKISAVLKAHIYLTCPFVEEVKFINSKEVVNDFFEGEDEVPHTWIQVDGWNIDLTARQFKDNADCPKVWPVKVRKSKKIQTTHHA